MKDNKKAKAQNGEAQEEIGGEVNESEMCGSKREASNRGDVVGGEASGGGMGGGDKAVKPVGWGITGR
jgi:hypothetical protein